MTITDRRSGSAGTLTITARLGGIPDGLGIKAPAYLATTANITLNGEQTIDGVSATAGKRVLVKDQTDAKENGVYDVATGDWTRSPDFTTNGDVVEGTRVFVTDGTVNSYSDWVVTSSDDIVIDTDNIVFQNMLTLANIATQAEAEAGTNNIRLMTPLRVAQALDGGQLSADLTDMFIGGSSSDLASITGFYEEDSYTDFGLTDGTLAVPLSTDQPPAVNMMRWINPDGSAGSGSSLANYVFNTVWRPGTRTSTDPQAVYGLFAGASGQNLNHPTTNHSIVALGGKGSNASSTYIDAYGLLTLAYNFSTTAVALGAELDIVNETGATVPTIQSGTLAGATIGLNILGTAVGTGSANNSVGILIQSDTAGKFRTGMYFATTPTEYGIDLRTVSGSAVPLLLPNNFSIASRNAANNNDVGIIKLDGSNLVSLYGGQVTISSAGATVVAGLLTGNLASAGNYSILSNGRFRVAGISGDTSAAIEFVPSGGSAAYLNLTTGNVWNFIDASSVNQMSLSAGAMTLGTAGTSRGSVVFSGNTSGTLTVRGPSTAGSNTLTLPAGTTDFSATGGTAQVVKQTSAGGAFTVATVAASEIASGQALTRVDDTNVTLTLGGTPTTALLAATSLTLGWTGQLGLTRGGTAASLTASNGGIVYSTASAMAILAGTATAGQVLRSGTSAAPSWSTATYPATAGTAGNVLRSDGTNFLSAALAGSDVTGAALTKTDDTNVTLTLGGTPTTALLRAASLTLGWTGTLAVSRGGTGLGSGTSGGVLAYTASGTLASSAALAANAIVVGGGAGAVPLTPATTPPTVSSAGVVNVVNATNATSVTTGALQVAGGMSAQLDVYGRQFYGVYSQDAQSFFQMTNTNAGSNAQATLNATADSGAIAISASSTARGGFANITATMANGVYHDYTGASSFAQFRIGGSFTSAFKVGVDQNTSQVSFGRATPVTETAATHSVATTTSYLICNRAGTITVTLPTASSFVGRELYIRNIDGSATVVSASSNVVPRVGGAAGTAILGAVDGDWALLVSDGTNWQVMAGP